MKIWTRGNSVSLECQIRGPKWFCCNLFKLNERCYAKCMILAGHVFCLLIWNFKPYKNIVWKTAHESYWFRGLFYQDEILRFCKTSLIFGVQYFKHLSKLCWKTGVFCEKIKKTGEKMYFNLAWKLLIK